MTTQAADSYPSDTINTSAGDLKITFIGHGTLILGFGGKVIHVDPYSALADYAALPKADMILITHDHADHLDPKALAHIRTKDSIVVCSASCLAKVPGGIVMTNGETRAVGGLQVEAVPAYNIVNKRAAGQAFHPKGVGNGYIVTFGDKRVYIAGDTENTPEMKALKDIYCAFLPMNLPYTMASEMVADAAKAFRPAILYPYHYGETDPKKLVELMKDVKGIEVRIRPMK